LKIISKPNNYFTLLLTFTNSKAIFEPNQTLNPYILKFEKQKLTIFQLLENVKKDPTKEKKI